MSCVAVSDELSIQKLDMIDFSPEVVVSDVQIGSVVILDDTIVTVELEDIFISCG